MAVFKIEKTKDFTVMSNFHLRDKNLTYKAKGLLSFINQKSIFYDIIYYMRLEKIQYIQIESSNANLSFNIDGFCSEVCCGKINLPDGEVFIAPSINTANGEIEFNVPSRYQGSTFEKIRLNFKDGMVVDYSSQTNNEKLAEILESDNGNKYIGEFAIGTNPNINSPRSNILFDEKMLGSFHIALGNSYSLSNNGNKASIHWDMVNILTENYGSGRIILDDEIIQENGIFVHHDLKELNSKILSKIKK